MSMGSLALRAEMNIMAREKSPQNPRRSQEAGCGPEPEGSGCARQSLLFPRRAIPRFTLTGERRICGP